MMEGSSGEGLLVTRFLREAQWKDEYPATPNFNLELCELLGFLQGHNRLDSFWPRLVSSRAGERDDALQEIRVARFLIMRGFPVGQWEPPGNGAYIGEFSVQAVPGQPIFVEVKSPGWEGQLSQEQRDAGRVAQGKYVDLEGGADDPWRGIRMSIRKAYPKFPASQPTLLVIADDRFVPLATWGKLAAEQALFIRSAALDGEPGYFTTSSFENLGGIGLFKAEDECSRGLQYTLLLYPNPMSRAEKLPTNLVQSFSGSQTPEH